MTDRRSRTTTAVRLEPEIHERLRKAAEQFGLPMNFLINRAMQEFLDNMIDPSEFTLTKHRAGGDA